MPLALKGAKARWYDRKVRREVLRHGRHVAEQLHLRPADTRPDTVYGVQMRHNLEAGSDTWATLVRVNRTRLQLTQTELAKLLGISRETVIRWEKGTYRPDSMETADAAIRALGIDREIGRRAAGYAPADDIPDPYAYVREMGLDPNSRVVRTILAMDVSEDFRMRMLRRERQLQLRDEQARLEDLEFIIEQQRQRDREAS